MKSGSTFKGVGNGAINTEQSESSDAEASIGQYTKGTPLEECQRSSTIEVIAGATNETIEEHENHLSNRCWSSRKPVKFTNRS